ncbi:MAG TPA: hypothetical protein PKW79_02850 [Rhabdochlamydiaceae bacterium]|nr:hypothetical protein [Rhabdochlamydiaceae bacterium]
MELIEELFKKNKKEEKTDPRTIEGIISTLLYEITNNKLLAGDCKSQADFYSHIHRMFKSYEEDQDLKNAINHIAQKLLLIFPNMSMGRKPESDQNDHDEENEKVVHLN